MARKPLKCHISLNEAYDINEDIDQIFDNVDLFVEKGFTPAKLFKLLKYEAGDRLINYKFPVTTAGVQVLTEHIEDIQTYVDLFTEKFKYKYLALLESEDFEYDPLDNTDITQTDEGTRTPNLSGSVTDTGTGSKTETHNLTDTETKNLTKTNNLTDQETQNLTRTDNLTAEDTKDLTSTNNLTDTTTFNDTMKHERDLTEGYTNYKETTTYTDLEDKTDYGKVVTNSVTSDQNVHSVVPYDAGGNYNNATKDLHTQSDSSTESGSDTKTRNGEVELAKSGTTDLGGDESNKHTGTIQLTKTGTVKETGTDTITNTGSVTNTGTDTITHTGTTTETGTDAIAHTGTKGEQSSTSNTRTTSQTGTEETENEMHRKGFQPQYSISSRQDMVNKYREVSDFSAVGIYIWEVSNYILLGLYSNLSFC